MPIESALVILIPEAEVLVGSFRNRYDPPAALGVPAHVTVLYPFKPPHELTEEVMQSLESLFARYQAFTTSFVEAKQFPGVLYLAPALDHTFRRLTELVTERFPETPAYDGEFADIVPHLTVAQVNDSRLMVHIAAEFESNAREHLPILANVREVALIDNESGYWQVRRRFPLAANASAP